MAKRQIQAGSTSVILGDIFLQDSSKSTGDGLAGLLFNSAGLTCYYHRNTGNVSVAVALANMTLGTFASGGFKEIDAVNMKGGYAFCPPDAAMAAGAQSVTFWFQGATNLAPMPIEVELTATNNQDAAAGGMTSIAAIKAKTDLIGTGNAVVNVPVLAGGNVRTQQGIDYFAADGQSLQWTVPGSFSLAGASVAVKLEGPETTISYSGTISDVPNRVAQLELSALQTSTLLAGDYTAYVNVTLSNNHKLAPIAVSWHHVAA